MADLTSFLQTLKSSSSYNSLLEVDPNMELILNQFGLLNQTHHENTTNLNYSHNQFFMGSSLNDQIGFFGTTQQANGTTTAVAAAAADHHHLHHHHQQQLVPSGVENYPANFHNLDEKNVMMLVDPGFQPASNPACLDLKKRKPSMDVSESSSGNSTIERKHSAGNKGKKIKVMNGKEEGIPKEVVHVRARRGQATDSHSLAERVRRGKINERLRCLQDIVPGCYKTMGMAVMLDEIINYVQSLQNQVEFLSMKLTEASSFHNFNSEMDHAVQLLQRAKAYNVEEIKKKHSVEREVERENGCTITVPPTQINGPFDPNFGTFPSLPYI